MDEYFGVAKDVGVTREEIEAVQSIVMAVSGGRVRTQLLDARMKAGQAAERRGVNEAALRSTPARSISTRSEPDGTACARVSSRNV